jgi:predicted HicB family RNase H-like nuclease
LRLAESIRRAAEDLAREDGVSLNQFVATAVAAR